MKWCLVSLYYWLLLLYIFNLCQQKYILIEEKENVNDLLIYYLAIVVVSIILVFEYLICNMLSSESITCVACCLCQKQDIFGVGLLSLKLKNGLLVACLTNFHQTSVKFHHSFVVASFAFFFSVSIPSSIVII